MIIAFISLFFVFMLLGFFGKQWKMDVLFTSLLLVYLGLQVVAEPVVSYIGIHTILIIIVIATGLEVFFSLRKKEIMIDSFDDILIEKQEVVEEKEAVEKQEVSEELGSSEKEELKIPMIHFIENPLPGTKKTVPKEMKYAYEP